MNIIKMMDITVIITILNFMLAIILLVNPYFLHEIHNTRLEKLEYRIKEIEKKIKERSELKNEER